MPAWLWIAIGGVAAVGATLYFANIIIGGDGRWVERVPDDYDPDPDWVRKPPDVPAQAVGDKLQGFDPMREPEKRKSFY